MVRRRRHVEHQSTHDIDFSALPRIPGEHAVVSDVRAKGGVNQHNYLHHFGGKYWLDGPEVVPEGWGLPR